MSDNFIDKNNANLSRNAEAQLVDFGGKKLQHLPDGIVRVVSDDGIQIRYDHMYATHHESADQNGLLTDARNSETTQPPCQQERPLTTTESEVNFIKDFLLIHLDLIQQQNDDIVTKENTIFLLQQENQQLREHIKSLETQLQARVCTPTELSVDHADSAQNEDMIIDSTTIVVEHTLEQAPIVQPASNLPIAAGIPEEASVSASEQIEATLAEPEQPQELKLLPLITTIKAELPDKDCNDYSEDCNSYSNITDCNSFFNSGSNYNSTDCNNYSPSTDCNSYTIINDCLDYNINIKKEAIDYNQDCNNYLNIREFNDYSNSKNCNDYSNSSYTIHSSGGSDQMKNLKMSIRRKRLCSNSSALSNNGSTSASDDKKHFRHHSRKKRKHVKNDELLTHAEQYITQVGDMHMMDIIRRQELAEEVARAATSANLEVPRWRVKVYTSCYALEGTENLEDDVFLRRHSRMENDEKRRKRWDVQRIREQRVIDKLKQRQDKIEANNKSITPITEEVEPIASMWPALDDVKYIEMCENLPVSAFGTPLPKIQPSVFSLPWLSNLSIKKTARRSGGLVSSRRRRRSSKR